MFAGKENPITTRSYKTAIIPVVVTILCLSPFANKAFHIDDPLFLWSAKQIQTSPADFYGFSVNWYGWTSPMSEVTKNPPGVCYYIALIALLFGWGEPTMHVAFLIPAAAAALGTYYLARKFCSRPAVAALAAVLTPGFLVSSTNIMCDTMMLAFWVWAVFLWVQGIEANKYLYLFFAAVLIGICALTKYFGMALLALLLIYTLVQKRKLGTWVLFLLVPVAMLAGYQWLTYNLYGRGLLSDAAAYAGSRSWTQGLNLFSKGLTALIFTGGCIITALFYIPLLLSRRALINIVVLTVLVIVTDGLMKETGRIPADSTGWNFPVQPALMALGGASVLMLTAADFRKWRNAESLLLLLWVFGTFIFAGFINWSINARSILPMAPATGILLMRRIDQRSNTTGRRRGIWWSVWPLIPAGAVAILVCWADYTLANTARSAAASIQKTFDDHRQAIWFEGHWGFQYYMEAAGGKALDIKHQQVARGDIIIIPSNNTNIIPLPQDRVRLSRTFKFYPYRKLTTVSPPLGAGFYAGIRGPLPFAAGPVGPELYHAFTVK